MSQIYEITRRDFSPEYFTSRRAALRSARIDEENGNIADLRPIDPIAALKQRDQCVGELESLLEKLVWWLYAYQPDAQFPPFSEAELKIIQGMVGSINPQRIVDEIKLRMGRY